MKNQAFLDVAPRSASPKSVTGGVDQRSLFFQHQPALDFSLRLHRGGMRRYDLRLTVFDMSLCFALFETPSINPCHRLRAKLLVDHGIDGFRSGLGADEAVDGGTFVPFFEDPSNQAEEVLQQLGRGDLRFSLFGRHLKGAWQLCGSGEEWKLRKLADEHSSVSRRLTLERAWESMPLPQGMNEGGFIVA